MSWFLIVRNFKLLEPYEGKLSRTVLGGESSRKGTDLPGKVQKSVLLIGEISDIYVRNFQKMLSDKNYSVDELSAIASGYAKLLEESTDAFQELKTVVSINGLSMSDKERMDQVDKSYNQIKHYRDLVSYYTRKNISVSYLRAKKANDLDRVLSLYGGTNDRYW